MDTASLTSLNLSVLTKDYLNKMRERHRYSLSYMINLVCMEHATDRLQEYYVAPPKPRGRPRIHPEKVEREKSHAEPTEGIEQYE